MKPDIAQLKKEVTSAGFRPAPFAFLVWNLRRILWPFIRQYHFFQLEQLIQTESRLDRTAEHVDRLAAEFRTFSRAQSEPGERSIVAGLQAELREEISRSTAAYGELRSLVRELNARNASVGSQFDRIRSELWAALEQQKALRNEFHIASAAQEELRNMVRELARRIDAVPLGSGESEGSLSGMSDELRRLVAAECELRSLVREIDGRTIVAWGHTDQIRAEVGSAIDHYTGVLGELQKFTIAHVELRSDVAAIANQQGILAEEITEYGSAQAVMKDVLHGLEARSEAAHGRIEESRGEIAALAGRQNELSEETRRAIGAQTELRELMGNFDGRNHAAQVRTEQLSKEIATITGRQEKDCEDIRRSVSAQTELRSIVLDMEGRNQAAQNHAEQLRSETSAILARQSEHHEAIRRSVAGQAEVRTMLLDLEGRSHATQTNTEQLRAEISHAAIRQSQLTGQLVRATAAQAELNSRLSELDERQQANQGHTEELQGEVTALGGRQSQAAGDIRRSAGVQAELRSAVAELDKRNKLFLANTDYGLFVLKSGDLISEFVATTGPWDAHLNPVIEAVGRQRGGLAVDAGAHIGLLSARMARHFPRVISFEPNAFNYRILVANMSINKLNHVECVNTALFSKPVHLSLGRPEQQEIPLPFDVTGGFDGQAASNLGAYSFTEDGTEIFPTAARTLDSYLLDNVALIKIDVQGADGEVIRGAAETIRRCKPVVIFEWEKHLSEKFGTSLETIMQLLQSIGYQVDLLKGINEKQTDFIARPRAAASDGYAAADLVSKSYA